MVCEWVWLIQCVLTNQIPLQDTISVLECGQPASKAVKVPPNKVSDAVFVGVALSGFHGDRSSHSGLSSPRS